MARKNPIAIAAAGLGLLIVWWFVFPTSEEDRIRERLHDLARVASTMDRQAGVGQLVHVPSLQPFFTEDVTVALHQDLPTVQGRSPLLHMAHAALQQEPTLAVAFTDISVLRDRDTNRARVQTTCVVSGASSQQAKSIDAKELEMELVKVKGAWVIQAIRSLEAMKLD